MNAWQQEIFGDTVINITSDQLTKLARELAGGYFGTDRCGKWKGDPTKMGEHFLNYLATTDGKQRLMNGLSEVIDMVSAGEPVKCDNGKLHGKGNGNLYPSNFGCA